MGKLIMWNLMSLDGMFEGPQPWDLDWHEYAWGDELKRFSLEQGREAEALRSPVGRSMIKAGG